MSAKTPPIGSFPGLRQGRSLFSAWTNALLAQADVWDAVWGKVRDGSHTPKDWSDAFVHSIEATAELMQQAIHTLTGTSAPPWATLLPKQPVEIAVRYLVKDTSELRVSAFTLLGAQPNQVPTAKATRVANYAISVLLDPYDSNQVAAGEYIALVFGKSPAPLAIVTASIPVPKKSDASSG